MNEVLSVTVLTGMIKRLLEEAFPIVTVSGEISNFKPHISGHWYFTLKDQNAQISCTMWKTYNSKTFFSPEDGMRVVITGRISLYQPRGTYQIEVRSIKPAGVGELQAKFERLKEKLFREGLFDSGHKRQIPRYPQKIGIATATGSAALKDMLSVAERRYPLARILIASCAVQGEGAPAEIVRALHLLNGQKGLDVIVLGRGGGSLEDLQAFNEEPVARAIYESSIPVVTGIGHEIDFTIADFVSDLRAPTPTAAMEMATPSKDEILGIIKDFSYNSTADITKILSSARERLSRELNSYGFRLPMDMLSQRSQTLDNIILRFTGTASVIFTEKNNLLNLVSKTIEAYDPMKVLQRGYSITSQEGRVVSRAKDFRPDTEAMIKFYDNELRVKINE